MVLRRAHFRIGVALVAAAWQLGLGGCAHRTAPIETGLIERRQVDGPVRGHWARVRLDDPAVRLGVTAPLPPGPADPAGAEALLGTVPEWMERNHAVLAINANFFAKLPSAVAGAGRTAGWVEAMPVDLIGLSISEGKIVSPPRAVGGQSDPVLLITREHRARIVCAGPGDLAGVACAVAGVGVTDNGKQPGSFLVTAGRNTGATARVAPTIRHPRTAAGTTADGKILILLVIDGRQPQHSIGATLPELADLMIELGAFHAINLDGGGSSSFVFRGRAGPLITNRPSDGHWRPVGNHLGVWIIPP